MSLDEALLARVNQALQIAANATPGPWDIIPKDCGDYFGECLTAPTGDVSGELLGWRAADIRLAAASPDLIQLIQDLVAAAEHPDGCGPSTGEKWWAVVDRDRLDDLMHYDTYGPDQIYDAAATPEEAAAWAESCNLDYALLPIEKPDEEEPPPGYERVYVRWRDA